MDDGRSRTNVAPWIDGQAELTFISWPPMAFDMLSLPLVRHSARLGRQPPPPWRWLPHLQQLHLQLQLLWQQD